MSKKLGKRIGSAVLALAMLSGLCTNVLAAQITTGKNYWMQSFDGLQADTAPQTMYAAITVDGKEVCYGESDSDMSSLNELGVFVGGVDALYGKSAGDTAAALERRAVSEGGYAGTASLKTDSNAANGMKMNSGVQCPIGGGNFAHVSFELAVPDVLAAKAVALTAQNTTKKTPSATVGTLMSIGENGAVTVFGASASYTMPTERWVKFDLVFGDTENTTIGSYVDVYADGVKIIEEKRFDGSTSKNMQQLGGIEMLSFQGNMSGETALYVDNFYAEKLGPDAYPVIDTVALTHTDPQIDGKIDSGTRSLSVPDSITAEELLAGFSPANAEIVDGAGNPQSGNVTDGYVRVPVRNGYLYYKLSTYQQDFLIRETFTGKTITTPEELAVQTELEYAGAGGVGSADGICARPEGDISLNLEDGGGISWTPEQGVQGERITAEASVLIRAGGSAELFLTLDGEKKSSVRFAPEGNILVAGTDSALRWSSNDWYKTVASVDSANSTWSIYVNGECLAQNLPLEDWDPGTSAAEGLELAVSGTAALDDIVVHTGQYIAGTDDVELLSDTTEYLIKEEEKTIYIPGWTEQATLEAGLKISENCSLDAVYTDETYTEQTDVAEDGSILVFRTKIDSVYESYLVKVLTQPLEIRSVSHARIKLDPENDEIFAPAYMTAEDFCKVFTLYPGHEGRVVDGTGRTLEAAEKYNLGTKDGYQYVVSYSNAAGTYERTYDILTQYVSENFDGLAGENISAGSVYHGFLYNKQGVSGGTVTASGVPDPDNEEETVCEFYSKPASTSGTSQITFRLADLEAEKTKSPYVLAWDMKMSNTNSANSLILKYVNKDGKPDNYYTLFEFASGGAVSFSGSGISNYSAGEWCRVVMVLDPNGTNHSRIYLNGKKIFDNSVGRFQKTIDSVQEFIFTHGITSAERITYADNFTFYPIASVAAFDASGMESTAKSEWDIISGSQINGYGPCTAAEFLNLFTFPQGAAFGLYQEDGITLVTEGTAEPGMKLIVTSADRVYTTEYILGEKIRITPPQILINGRNMKYLIPGEATAKASIYSASPLEAQLTLTYAKNDAVSQATAERTAEMLGETELITPVAGTVENVEGEKLNVKLIDTKTGQPLAEPKEIEWTGRLDLSSEVTMAKNGATSIVTVTLDDGLTTALNKCNKWFEQFGLKGTSVIWSDRAAGSKQSYAKLYEPGYIDVASHSKTHKDLTNYGNLTEALRMSEIQGSRDELREMFPSQEVLTFAPSNNRMDSVSEEIVGEYYWAVRQGKRGYNSLDPKEGDGMGAWNNLLIQGSYNPQNMAGVACSLNDCLDEAAENPVWLIEMYHSIETKEGVGTLPVTDSIAQPHFKKMGELQDQGKIWVASLNEATKYIRERQHTTVTDIATETERTIKLELDGELPPEVFNAPLTVKSQVPDAWAVEGKYVKVSQGGAVQAPVVQNIDGGLYVLYDAYPNGVPIQLEAVDEVPLVTVKEISIKAEGELTQTAGQMVPVTFTASTKPVDNTNTSGIEWYVNEEKQEQITSGTLTFAFQTQRIGKYSVYAKDNISGLVSKAITIEVKEPGLLFEDNFQEYDGQLLPDSKWYATTDIYLEEYPPQSGNTAAKITYNSAALYPGMHKTVSAPGGAPVVFSGDVALKGEKQSFYLEMRNTANTAAANRISAMQFKGTEVTAIDGTVIGKVPQGDWLHYALLVVPAANGEKSTVRTVLSGPTLTGPNGENKGAPVVYEIPWNLDALAIAENGTVNMVHNNNFSKADGSCATYLNNVRIYAPQSLAMLETGGKLYCNKPVVLAMNQELYGFAPDMIQVTDAQGNPVECSAALDNTGCRKLTLTFPEPLHKGKTYQVAFDGGAQALNVQGLAAGTAVGEFTVSQLDAVSGLVLEWEGSLEQNEDTLSRVYFHAAAEPVQADTETICWYINGKKQDAQGTEFNFKPSTRGVYQITAEADGVVSQPVAVTVTAGFAKGIAITALGSVNQAADSITEVTFAAQGVPEGTILPSETVTWYLDGVQVAQGTNTFSYTPPGIGVHTVYARMGEGEQLQSNTITLRVEEVVLAKQEFLLQDEFEKHGGEKTILDASNAAPWFRALQDDSKWIEIAKDPKDESNLCGKFSYASSKDEYPRLEASGVPVQVGVPVVMSGKLHLSAASAFILELVGGSRKELVKIDKGKEIIVNGESVVGTACQPDGWIWFSACVTPAEDLSQSAIRVVLSGNVTGNKVIESTVNLSGVGLRDKATVYYNTALKAGKSDAVYLDQAKIYVPQAAYISLKAKPEKGDTRIWVSFNHDIDPASFSVENVLVQAERGGEMVSVAVQGVDFDPLNPGEADILLEAGLEEAVQYTISLQGNVQDNQGRGVYGVVEFQAEQAEPEEFQVTDLHFTNGTDRITEVDWSGTLKGNVQVKNTTEEEASFELIAACYQPDGSLKQLYRQTIKALSGESKTVSIDIPVSQEMDGGTVKLFVWNGVDTMKPLSGKAEIN